MLTIFTLELFSGRSRFDKEPDFIKKSKPNSITEDHAAEQKITADISREKEHRMDNFIILLPILLTLIAIIIMTILNKIFY